MRLFVVVAIFGLVALANGAATRNKRLLGGLLGGSASGSASVSGGASASGGGLLGGVLGGSGGGVLGGVLGGGGGGVLDGVLGGGGGGLLSGLGDSLKDTLGTLGVDLGGALGNLVDQILALVQNLLQSLADALNTGENVSGAVNNAALELASNVDIAELGAVVAEFVRRLPRLDANNFVASVALNLNSRNVLRFLGDLRRLGVNVDLPRVVAQLTLSMSNSMVLDIIVDLVSDLGLNLQTFLASVFAQLPLSQFVSFASAVQLRLPTVNVLQIATNVLTNLQASLRASLRASGAVAATG